MLVFNSGMMCVGNTLHNQNPLSPAPPPVNPCCVTLHPFPPATHPTTPCHPHSTKAELAAAREQAAASEATAHKAALQAAVAGERAGRAEREAAAAGAAAQERAARDQELVKLTQVGGGLGGCFWRGGGGDRRRGGWGSMCTRRGHASATCCVWGVCSASHPYHPVLRRLTCTWPLLGFSTTQQGHLDQLEQRQGHFAAPSSSPAT
jgi:hypothetical protein